MSPADDTDLGMLEAGQMAARYRRGEASQLEATRAAVDRIPAREYP